jgi:hypothetical protein
LNETFHSESRSSKELVISNIRNLNQYLEQSLEPNENKLAYAHNATSSNYLFYTSSIGSRNDDGSPFEFISTNSPSLSSSFSLSSHFKSTCLIVIFLNLII